MCGWVVGSIKNILTYLLTHEQNEVVSIQKTCANKVTDNDMYSIAELPLLLKSILTRKQFALFSYSKRIQVHFRFRQCNKFLKGQSFHAVCGLLN